MKNISKLLLANATVFILSTAISPLMAEDTDFTFNIDTTPANVLTFSTNTIQGGLLSGSGQIFNIIGDLVFDGSNIQQGQTCKLSFSSLNQAGSSFRMVSADDSALFTQYTVGLTLSSNGGTATAKTLTQNFNTVETADNGSGTCSLSISGITINLATQIGNLTGSYGDTMTITSSVI